MLAMSRGKMGIFANPRVLSWPILGSPAHAQASLPRVSRRPTAMVPRASIRQHTYLSRTLSAITFHDRVEHPRFETQHHVETRHVRTLDILKTLWCGFDRSVTGCKAQKVILEKKRLVFALQSVVEAPVWRSEREYFRAGDVLSRQPQVPSSRKEG